jgi:hypothetical protein
MRNSGQNFRAFVLSQTFSLAFDFESCLARCKKARHPDDWLLRTRARIFTSIPVLEMGVASSPSSSACQSAFSTQVEQIPQNKKIEVGKKRRTR